MSLFFLPSIESIFNSFVAKKLKKKEDDLKAILPKPDHFDKKISYDISQPRINSGIKLPDFCDD